MQIKSEFPHSVREIENTWIPMSDGCKLAARIWLPEDAEQHPVPAILEYIPYRKDDSTAPEDSTRHPYFAGHGYASVRVDLRGSGDSDGILYDEYLLQEQDDALEILAWLAAQPWCTAAAGMIGYSWGGFNGLQVAARRPPQLKAVISLCSTDDRYNDDCHYMGGCLLGSDMLKWASTMLAYNARPPDPRFVGERWREMWLERMERTPPFIEAWLTHQRQDDFWKHGSVRENYDDITCPVYLVGGWTDAYTNAIPHLLAGLTCPRKGLIGPWAHNFPEHGVPGPAIGFLQECLRWWDFWLKGVDTGIMAEPMLRAWMQESVEPRTFYAVRPGRWIAEPAWPSPHITPQTFILKGDGMLTSAPLSHPDRREDEGEVRLDLDGAQVCGLQAGVWCPYGSQAELPGDQRAEDGLSLCFTSAPLEAPLEILGFPEVRLAVAVDQPNALLAVRLCDVAPGGASTLVSWGLLNLTHRESHETPTPLEPGRRYLVTVRLNAVAHSLPAGHRWRMAVSPTYWPHAWPSPQPVVLSLFADGTSQLDLPVRPPRREDSELAPFGPPEIAAPLAAERLSLGGRSRTVRRDVITGLAQIIDHSERGGFRIVANGTEYERSGIDIFSIVEGDPLSASVQCDLTVKIGRGAWRTRVETSSLLSANAAEFRVTNILNAYEGHVRVFSKTWDFSVVRELM